MSPIYQIQAPQLHKSHFIGILHDMETDGKRYSLVGLIARSVYALTEVQPPF